MTRPMPFVHSTVIHMLVDAARRAPDREALVWAGERLSYREYLNCIAACAGMLGKVAGERVATVLPNSPDAAIAIFAVQAAGAQLAPLNPEYSAYELRPILIDAAPAVVICDDAAAKTVEPIAGEIGARCIRLSGGRDLLRWRNDRDARSQERLLERLLDRLPAPEDLAILQYTGGTTGRAKGVNLSHRAVSTNVAQREALLPTRPEAERVLAVTPLFHSYAMTMGLHLSASCRGTLILLPRYRPELVLATIAAERVTRFCGSPTLFTGLMAHEDFGKTDFSSLASCYSGAAALPGETLRRWESGTNCGICEGYGQTEAGPILTFNPEKGGRKTGSVGVAVPDTQVQIVDIETGRHVLETGQKGEIRARGPQLMSGYRNLPQETAQALREGWLYTGDIGELDAEGYLYIRDRKKDMVIVAGLNVYPREVEEALAQHPDVAEAAVVGVAHAYRGEALRAFVVPRQGGALTAEALASHLGERLVRYKLPDEITLVPFLPKTSIGKIDKLRLRKGEIRQG